MNFAIKKLYNELQEDIAFYAEMGTPPVNRLSGTLISIRSIMIRLKVLVVTEGFANDEAEIKFFKTEKPLFVSEQIYLTKYTTIFLGMPSISEGLLEAYYVEELRRLQIFINRFGFLYQCYKLEASDLDNVLFLRNAGPSGMVLPETPDADPVFSTNGDYLWAKFMAYERLQVWLEEELKILRGGITENGLKGSPSTGENGRIAMPPGALKWTGETINLVEIAYGIWLTGQLNNGNASITEIMEFLEVVFRVKVGKPHRRWQSLTRRKRLAVFRYVDEIKLALVKRMEEELEN